MIKIVNTWSEALKLSHEFSDKYAVKICDNIYHSDKDFNGVILWVHNEDAK